MKTWGLCSFAAACLAACLVFNGCSSPTTSGSTTPVSPANPTVASISPAVLSAGALATTLNVTGTGYTTSSTVQVGGVVEPSTYVSATQLTASVPPGQLVQGALLPVIVLNGTATSAAGAVNLEVDNPAPKISSFTPAAFSAGSASTAVSITGTGFVPTTSIQVAGVNRSTTYVGATQVSVILTAADLASAGSLSIVAVNAAPVGGTSAAASVAVNNPVPGALSLTPATVVTGASSATTVSVAGTNFTAASSVLVGAVARATTFVSSIQLTFQLSVADQVAAARLSITVVNPAPGGGTSPTAILNVSVPTPTPILWQIYPSSFLVGSATSPVEVLGSNLIPGDTILWNGAPLNTAFNSNYNGGYLVGVVPASLLASVGTASVTVNSPTSTPALSNALSVSIANPPAPTLTSLSPASGPIGAATAISLYGTGFTSVSTVSLNGMVIPSVYSGPLVLSTTIPAASVAAPGNYSLTVTTPAPGGGTSGALIYTAYIPIVNNSMIYNPANGLFYVSVPGYAGAPMGNSIVSVDPATGALGTPIPVGSEPNKLALTSDGRYLWVGLNGAGAVRKVDLAAGKAGLQFYLGGNSGTYNSPLTAVALAALPGQTDSVVVQTSTPIFDAYLNIYDAGVLRGTGLTLNNYPSGNYALAVDGTRGEIYAAGAGYSTYTYGASGAVLKATSTARTTYATFGVDEIQIVGGRLYTGQGKVFDAESGALLGTFYSAGTTVAAGTATADSTLGKVFVLDYPVNNSGISSGNQIQIFNSSDFNPSTSSVIPVSIAYQTDTNRLTRWGANGLAFRSSVGIYSLRSNLVKDLSTTSADVGVALAATGPTITGSTTTYTATLANAGPSAATSVGLSATLPSTGILLSATPSIGTCSTAAPVTCDVGLLASGASAQVVFQVQQNTAGIISAQVGVSASENDPVTTNNTASASVTITGSSFSLKPAVTSISPAAVASGSPDTVVTVTGSGFINGSNIVIGSSQLLTSYVSPTQLSATVPAAILASLGWSPLTVVTPPPGGGTSTPVPLTVFKVVTAGLNRILYDPYSRQIMASVGSGSSAVTGNSIVSITPATGQVGTPVFIGSQPQNLALTSDGQILYTILAGSNSIARFNMLTQAADFTYTPTANSSFAGGIALRGIATQPGTEDTIALDLASFTGNAIYDFNPATMTAAIRGQASGPYTGSCLSFLDFSNLFAVDTDTSGSTFDHYTVTSAGLIYYNYAQYSISTLFRFGCFKLSGGLAYSNSGGVANPSTTPATQLGVFPYSATSTFSTLQDVAPDNSLQRVFFAGNWGTSYSSTPDSIEAFDPNTFLLSSTTPIPFATIEGSTTYSVYDTIRWGQDGLAILTSGHLYLLRGPVVVPGLLTTSTAAILTSASVATAIHGSGNLTLTLTGTNFLPGVAVAWNGSYRTTTITDATHVTIAIPAGDLATAGTATLTATNPGATASSGLAFTVN